ncbi:DUF397 domain-containing protein [Actinomadura gamaensis]|uniref:DUF397 domain-containing protein n=1 Tax=Actinomadura gamaensis TaxID=1763541 RepID=A0ABV9TTK2_9ACTN
MKTDMPVWRKSSYSGENGGACIEVADFMTGVGVRDSKDPEGPCLGVTREDFAAVAEIIKRG